MYSFQISFYIILTIIGFLIINNEDDDDDKDGGIMQPVYNLSLIHI